MDVEGLFSGETAGSSTGPVDARHFLTDLNMAKAATAKEKPDS